jgi:hypothetical protein
MEVLDGRSPVGGQCGSRVDGWKGGTGNVIIAFEMNACEMSRYYVVEVNVALKRVVLL